MTDNLQVNHPSERGPDASPTPSLQVFSFASPPAQSTPSPSANSPTSKLTSAHALAFKQKFEDVILNLNRSVATVKTFREFFHAMGIEERQIDSNEPLSLELLASNETNVQRISKCISEWHLEMTILRENELNHKHKLDRCMFDLEEMKHRCMVQETQLNSLMEQLYHSQNEDSFILQSNHANLDQSIQAIQPTFTTDLVEKLKRAIQNSIDRNCTSKVAEKAPNLNSNETESVSAKLDHIGKDVDEIVSEVDTDIKSIDSSINSAISKLKQRVYELEDMNSELTFKLQQEQELNIRKVSEYQLERQALAAEFDLQLLEKDRSLSHLQERIVQLAHQLKAKSDRCVEYEQLLSQSEERVKLHLEEMGRNQDVYRREMANTDEVRVRELESALSRMNEIVEIPDDLMTIEEWGEREQVYERKMKELQQQHEEQRTDLKE